MCSLCTLTFSQLPTGTCSVERPSVVLDLIGSRRSDAELLDISHIRTPDARLDPTELTLHNEALLNISCLDSRLSCPTPKTKRIPHATTMREFLPHLKATARGLPPNGASLVQRAAVQVTSGVDDASRRRPRCRRSSDDVRGELHRHAFEVRQSARQEHVRFI